MWSKRLLMISALIVALVSVGLISACSGDKDSGSKVSKNGAKGKPGAGTRGDGKGTRDDEDAQGELDSKDIILIGKKIDDGSEDTSANAQILTKIRDNVADTPLNANLLDKGGNASDGTAFTDLGNDGLLLKLTNKLKAKSETEQQADLELASLIRGFEFESTVDNQNQHLIGAKVIIVTGENTRDKIDFTPTLVANNNTRTTITKGNWSLDIYCLDGSALCNIRQIHLKHQQPGDSSNTPVVDANGNRTDTPVEGALTKTRLAEAFIIERDTSVATVVDKTATKYFADINTNNFHDIFHFLKRAVLLKNDPNTLETIVNQRLLTTKVVNGAANFRYSIVARDKSLEVKDHEQIEIAGDLVVDQDGTTQVNRTQGDVANLGPKLSLYKSSGPDILTSYLPNVEQTPNLAPQLVRNDGENQIVIDVFPKSGDGKNVEGVIRLNITRNHPRLVNQGE